MHRTFSKILLSYVFSVVVIFVIFGSFISSAQSSGVPGTEAGGWLADIIISGVHMFIKLVLAIT